ncbi:hypothetical protein ERO13_A05G344400v2 [Gossypium hirsutum]|nr:hypothetical protein ERO13_A05G344400v2 [Gossypium hirsutum]
MKSGNQVREKMSREKPRRANLPPVQENINKLEKVISDGNSYGAQQMYKSISTRYVSAQRCAEALDLLHSGACLQLKHGEVTCGSELAVMFVDALVKGKIPCDPEIVDRIRKIYKLFPQIPVPSNFAVEDDVQELTEALGAAKTRLQSCYSFLKAAIKWSAEFGADKNGDPQLHTMLAEYIYSESPEMCYPGEDDIAIARAILMYLSMGNLQDASSLMEELKKQVQAQELEFPVSDLIQFINLLLLTLEKETLPLFNALRVKYKPSIDREPAFNELVCDIAEKFYGMQRRNPFQDMFGDMLKMM